MTDSVLSLPAKKIKDSDAGRVYEVPFAGQWLGYLHLRMGGWADFLDVKSMIPLAINHLRRLDRIITAVVVRKRGWIKKSNWRLVGTMPFEDGSDGKEPLMSLMYAGENIAAATVTDPITKRARVATEQERRTYPRLQLFSVEQVHWRLESMLADISEFR